MGEKRGRAPNDRISNLPDELLVEILCGLSMKDAIKTTALSSRWKHLWYYYSGCINFETLNVVARILKEYRVISDNDRYYYCKFVNRVLKSLKSPTIDEFKVVFGLHKNYATDIDRWIHFALVERTGLRKLELNFAPSYDQYFSRDTSHAFPARLLDMEIRSFETLSILRFTALDITDHILAFFISKCPFLEHFSVAHSCSLLHVKVVGTPSSSLKLKHFEIDNCPNIEDVEISSATNLVSFKWDGLETNSLHFKNVPCLTQISFGEQQSHFLFRRSHDDLSFYLTQMQTLILNFKYEAILGKLSFSERLPKFSNLKHLEVQLSARVDQTLLFLTCLIYDACPLLVTFTLKVLHRKLSKELRECVWRDEGKKYPHESLKVVEFIGWGGFEHEFQLANYLLENTLLLEKIIIHAREFYRFPEELEHIYGSPIYNKETARKRAEQLEAKVPPGVDLIIL